MNSTQYHQEQASTIIDPLLTVPQKNNDPDVVVSSENILIKNEDTESTKELQGHTQLLQTSISELQKTFAESQRLLKENLQASLERNLQTSQVSFAQKMQGLEAASQRAKVILENKKKRNQGHSSLLVNKLGVLLRKEDANTIIDHDDDEVVQPKSSTNIKKLLEGQAIGNDLGRLKKKVHLEEEAKKTNQDKTPQMIEEEKGDPTAIARQQQFQQLLEQKQKEIDNLQKKMADLEQRKDKKMQAVLSKQQPPQDMHDKYEKVDAEEEEEEKEGEKEDYDSRKKRIKPSNQKRRFKAANNKKTQSNDEQEEEKDSEEHAAQRHIDAFNSVLSQFDPYFEATAIQGDCEHCQFNKESLGSYLHVRPAVTSVAENIEYLNGLLKLLEKRTSELEQHRPTEAEPKAEAAVASNNKNPKPQIPNNSKKQQEIYTRGGRSRLEPSSGAIKPDEPQQPTKKEEKINFKPCEMGKPKTEALVTSQRKTRSQKDILSREENNSVVTQPQPNGGNEGKKTKSQIENLV